MHNMKLIYGVRKLIAVLLVFTTVLGVVESQAVYNGTNSASDFIEALLDPRIYNKKERPLLTEGKPVFVDVDLFVSSISGISEISMDYSINMFLRQRWNDPRLSFLNHSVFNETITLNHDLVQKFWVADLFITNERTKGSFHDITVPNILLQVSPNGNILYSQRISSSLACHMLLNKYPLDEQTCDMEFESYGHTTKDIIFEWRDITEPVQVNQKMELPEFNLTGVQIDGCTAAYTTGAFSCIKATFNLKRLFQYYLIQVYVPSILIVVLSWVSFWIDIHAVPARISVGLLTVLTITTQSSGISSKLPRVSYIKAIDVWMFISMLFMFGALIEYSVVNVLARAHKDKVEAMNKKREAEEAELSIDDVGDSLKQPSSKENDTSDIVKRSNNKDDKRVHPAKDVKPFMSNSNATNEKKMSWFRRVRFNKALMVDTLSRLIFPAVYIVFNIFYWVYYV